MSFSFLLYLSLRPPAEAAGGKFAGYRRFCRALPRAPRRSCKASAEAAIGFLVGFTVAFPPELGEHVAISHIAPLILFSQRGKDGLENITVSHITEPE